jgi:hypothetical protein
LFKVQSPGKSKMTISLTSQLDLVGQPDPADPLCFDGPDLILVYFSLHDISLVFPATPGGFCAEDTDEEPLKSDQRLLVDSSLK